MNITKALLIVAAVSATLLAAWFVQRRAVPAPEQPAASQPGIPDDADGRVLKQLVSNGSDLSKPHNLEFFLDFPDQERARTACGTLGTEGYTSKVKALDGKESKWECMATKRLVPSYEAITAISLRMEDLAKAQGGIYDGWGTLVEK